MKLIRRISSYECLTPVLVWYAIKQIKDFVALHLKKKQEQKECVGFQIVPTQHFHRHQSFTPNWNELYTLLIAKMVFYYSVQLNYTHKIKKVVI